MESEFHHLMRIGHHRVECRNGRSTTTCAEIDLGGGNTKQIDLKCGRWMTKMLWKNVYLDDECATNDDYWSIRIGVDISNYCRCWHGDNWRYCYSKSLHACFSVRRSVCVCVCVCVCVECVFLFFFAMYGIVINNGAGAFTSGHRSMSYSPSS